MRKSRVILTGIVVAAAAAAGSAFTAANDFSAVADNAVGYGKTTVSGATITGSAYAVNATDRSKLDSITYTTSTEIVTPGNVAHLYLSDGSTPVVDLVCGLGTYTASAQDITCTFVAPVAIDSFDTLELTVLPA
jgi:hypothetical protein